MTAEEIVKDLADFMPTIHTAHTWHVCGLCERPLVVDITDHREDCLWRRAKEWTEEND